MTVLYATLLACLLTVTNSTAQPGKPQQQMLVIAYYSGNATEIDRFEIDKLTHIIYSFVLLRRNQLHVSPAAGSILRKLVSLKTKHPQLKIQVAFGGHPFSPADTRNFTLLMQALRHTLGNEKEISFAAGGFSEFLEKSVEWKKVIPFVSSIRSTYLATRL